jgi:signal transduction histidine kinase
MSIVQLGLLFATLVPVVFAVRVAFSRRRPSQATGNAARHDMGGSVGCYLTRPRSDSETLDLARAVRAAADEVDGLAWAYFVGIDLAVDPGISLRADPTMSRAVLSSTIGTSVRAAPGGHVLVTAHVLREQAHIRIIDDGTSADQRSRESRLREPADLLALLGGSLAVEARPGRGTAVTIRLPLAGSDPEENDPRAMRTLVEQDA